MTLVVILILSALNTALLVVSRSVPGIRTWISAIATAAVFFVSVIFSAGIGWWSMLVLLGVAAIIWVLMQCGAERLSLRSAMKPSTSALGSLTVVLNTAAFIIFFSALTKETAPVTLGQMGLSVTSMVVISATSLVGVVHRQVPSLSDHQGPDQVERLWKVWRRLICTGVLAILVIGGYSATMLGNPNWAAVFTVPVIAATAAPLAGLIIGVLVLRVNREEIAHPRRRVATRIVIWGVCLVNALIWFLLPRAGLDNLTPISWTAIIPLLAGAFLLIPEDYWGNILLNGWDYRFRDLSPAIAIGLASSIFMFTHIGVRYFTNRGPDVELIYQHCIVAIVQLASIVWAARALGTLAAARQKEPKRMPSTLAQSLTNDSLMYTWLLAASVVGISTKLTPGLDSSSAASLLVIGAVAGIVYFAWKGHIKQQSLRTKDESWHSAYIRGLTLQRRGQLLAVLLTAIPAAGAAIFGGTS